MEKFKKIFSGLTIAYGQYQKGERGSNGKLKGKAFIVRKNVTDKLWEDHLAGNPPALGLSLLQKIIIVSGAVLTSTFIILNITLLFRLLGN